MIDLDVWISNAKQKFGPWPYDQIIIICEELREAQERIKELQETNHVLVKRTCKRLATEERLRSAEEALKHYANIKIDANANYLQVLSHGHMAQAHFSKYEALKGDEE